MSRSSNDRVRDQKSTADKNDKAWFVYMFNSDTEVFDPSNNVLNIESM